MTATTLAPPTPELARDADLASPQRGALAWLLRDTATMTGRSLRHATRNIDSLIMALVLPVMLMLLFVYVFGGAISTVPSYVNYVVPGIVILCAGYGASMVGVSVCADVVGQIVDRFRTLPVASSTVLVGHVLAGVARNLVSTAIVVGLAFALGFRPDAGPLEWLAALGLLLLVIWAISWVSVCFGLIANSPEAASGFSFFILFLPYVSSAFVPTSTMPAALQAVADHQPITPVIEALRGLLTGTPVGSSAAVAVVWFGAISILAMTAATALFRRRTSS